MTEVSKQHPLRVVCSIHVVLHKLSHSCCIAHSQPSQVLKTRWYMSDSSQAEAEPRGDQVALVLKASHKDATSHVV